MKIVRLFLVGCLSFVLMLVLVGPGLADDAGDDTEPDTTEQETEDTEDTEGTLNETQQEKAQRLSDASGVSVDDILSMRNGTYVPAEGTEGPNGRGWGNIAKYLGLHPGVLGKGTGDKFMPSDDETGDSLLSKRQSKRDSRLNRKQGDDTEDGEGTGKERNAEKRLEKQARRDERNRDKQTGRDKDRGRDKGKKDKSGSRGKSGK